MSENVEMNFNFESEEEAFQAAMDMAEINQFPAGTKFSLGAYSFEVMDEDRNIKSIDPSLTPHSKNQLAYLLPGEENEKANDTVVTHFIDSDTKFYHKYVIPIFNGEYLLNLVVPKEPKKLFNPVYYGDVEVNESVAKGKKITNSIDVINFLQNSYFLKFVSAIVNIDICWNPDNIEVRMILDKDPGSNKVAVITIHGEQPLPKRLQSNMIDPDETCNSMILDQNIVPEVNSEFSSRISCVENTHLPIKVLTANFFSLHPKINFLPHHLWTFYLSYVAPLMAQLVMGFYNDMLEGGHTDYENYMLTHQVLNAAFAASVDINGYGLRLKIEAMPGVMVAENRVFKYIYDIDTKMHNVSFIPIDTIGEDEPIECTAEDIFFPYQIHMLFSTSFSQVLVNQVNFLGTRSINGNEFMGLGIEKEIIAPSRLNSSLMEDQAYTESTISTSNVKDAFGRNIVSSYWKFGITKDATAQLHVGAAIQEVMSADIRYDSTRLYGIIDINYDNVLQSDLYTYKDILEAINDEALNIFFMSRDDKLIACDPDLKILDFSENATKKVFNETVKLYCSVIYRNPMSMRILLAGAPVNVFDSLDTSAVDKTLIGKRSKKTKKWGK